MKSETVTTNDETQAMLTDYIMQFMLKLEHVKRYDNIAF